MTVTKIGEEFIALLHKRSPEAGSPRLEEGLSDVIRSLSSICLATRASSVSFYFLIDQPRGLFKLHPSRLCSCSWKAEEGAKKGLPLPLKDPSPKLPLTLLTHIPLAISHMTNRAAKEAGKWARL